MILLSPRPLPAMPKNRDAAAKLEEGLSRYRAEDYEAAAEAFREGYEIEADPTFLYTWAQAERLRGDCAEAVKLYTRFIESKPPEIQVQAAQEGKARCADALAERTTQEDTSLDDDELDALADTANPETSLPAPVPTTASRAGAADEAEPPEPWQRDPAGGVLVGIGSAGLATGIGLLVAGAVLRQRVPASYTEAQTQPRRVQGLTIAGGVTLGVGAALLVAGAIRYGVLARRQRDNTFAAAFDGQTAMVWFSQRF